MLERNDLMSYFVIYAVLLTVLSSFVVQRASADLNLVILHNNDIHSHFDPVSAATSQCRPHEKCYGGIGRLVRAVKAFKKHVPNTLVLYGGDVYQGHVYYSLFKWRVVVDMINMVPYDAMALGNHEFDDGLEGLLPYMAHVKHPLLCTNIDFGFHANNDTKSCRQSVIREIGGYKVGILGYTTPATAQTSNPPEGVTFLDEIQTLQSEARRLQAAGAKIIIALGHSGYVRERKMAEKIDGVDLIVGGHSHSLLYTGRPPDGDDAEGPYPTVVRQKSGRTVLVVQAYQYGKYLGVLNVTFDAFGEVSSWWGNPVVLDGGEDPEAVQQLKRYSGQVHALMNKVIGRSLVRLEGSRRVCRRRECNLGNFIADGMVRALLQPSKAGWNAVSAAVCQGGGIRDSIEAGNVTAAHAENIHPFGNELGIIFLPGSAVYEVFEHSVSGLENLEGQFLQVSGIRVAYNLSKPVGLRVEKLEITCTNCSIPKLERVRRNKIYSLGISTYLAKGGDGFEVFIKKRLDYIPLGYRLADVLHKHVKQMSPIFTGLENRIVFLEPYRKPATSSAPFKKANFLVITHLCTICVTLVRVCV